MRRPKGAWASGASMPPPTEAAAIRGRLAVSRGNPGAIMKPGIGRSRGKLGYIAWATAGLPHRTLSAAFGASLVPWAR